MLHNDVGTTKASLNSIELGKDSNLTFRDAFREFDHPIEAALKIMAMYIGEMDLTEMPIGISKGMKHGNVAFTMILIFVLAFIFFIVMVLGNLLNGLAVRDTGEILKRAGILHQVSLAKFLCFSDHLILGNLQYFRNIAQKVPKLKGFLEKTIISELSSFLLSKSFIHFMPNGSTYLEVRIPLIAPKGLNTLLELHGRRRKNIVLKFFSIFSKFLNFILRCIPLCDEELNYGCEEFLDESRKILKKKRLSKIKRRKEKDAKRKENQYIRTLLRKEIQVCTK